MPLRATGGVNSTPHRAHVTRATHAIFLVCTWLKTFELCCSTFHLIQVSPHLAWPTTCTWFVYHCVALSFGEFIRCHCARRVMLWPNNPLSHFTPWSPHLNLPGRPRLECCPVWTASGSLLAPLRWRQTAR